MMVFSKFFLRIYSLVIGNVFPWKYIIDLFIIGTISTYPVNITWLTININHFQGWINYVKILFLLLTRNK